MNNDYPRSVPCRVGAAPGGDPEDGFNTSSKIQCLMTDFNLRNVVSTKILGGGKNIF